MGFTNLIKACLRIPTLFPILIDWFMAPPVIRSLAFLKLTQGIIKSIHHLDEEKTTFITEQVNYCYEVMSFDLKNIGATYQKLIEKVFQEKISKWMEVHADDLVVKSQLVTQHMKDLTEIFNQI